MLARQVGSRLAEFFAGAARLRSVRGNVTDPLHLRNYHSNRWRKSDAPSKEPFWNRKAQYFSSLASTHRFLDIADEALRGSKNENTCQMMNHSN